jgi:hypothetical protein
MKSLYALVIFICVGSCSLAQDTTVTTFSKGELEMMNTADSIVLYRLFDMSTLHKLPSIIPPLEIERTGSSPDFYDSDRGIAYRKKAKREMTIIEKKELLELLTYRDNKLSDSIVDCKFAPGAAIKFYKGKERFYLLMCFNCDVWAFKRREAIYYIKYSEGHRKQLVDYAKKLYPNDYEFQLLK